MNFNESDVNNIINILENNEECIEEDYNDKEDLICINSDLRSKIFNSLTGSEKENKELVRFSVREAFELDNRDIVVIQEQQIIIKLLDDNSIHEVNEEDIGTIANRYNGINEDDLESFYNEIFLKEEDDEFFYTVAESYVKNHLLSKKLDNKTYEQNVFSTIQSIITKKLMNRFENHDNFFKGFSGYIFRIHFKEVFDYISELLLIELSKSNGYVMDFLKYYSLKVVIVNGVKYDVPEIIEDSGFRWNVASLVPVIKVYIKSAQACDSLEMRQEYLNNKLEDHYISNTSPVAYNHAINSEIKKLSQDILEDRSKLDRYIGTLKDKPNDIELKQEIQEIREDLQFMRDEKEMLLNKVLPRDTINRYTELKKEADTIFRQIKREEQIIERNEKQFISIKDALTKALTSKKTPAKTL